MNSIICISTIL